MGYALKLDTNGSLPMILKGLFESNLVDYVAMDTQTILDLKEYYNICGIKDSQLLIKIEKSIEVIRE